VSVDLGQRYLETAARNVALAERPECRHEVLVADVFDTLRDFARSGRRFDAVLCDPPTFSSSRRSGAFSVKERYRPLVRASLRVLEPGGLLACATNWRGIGRDAFLRLLADAAHAEGVDLRVLTVLGQPVDHPVLPSFPEAAYLHFALCSTARRP
jgi:23S rRNA (cytosine1962-C5)-methyltransferase